MEFRKPSDQRNPKELDDDNVHLTPRCTQWSFQIANLVSKKIELTGDAPPVRDETNITPRHHTHQ